MKNITITLDDETAAWLRAEAGRRGQSVSRLVGELLRERNHDLLAYERAMHDFFTRPRTLVNIGSPRPTREEIYDRAVLRR
jgi:flagellar biosynthesis/type III secretory pathway ATPase